MKPLSLTLLVSIAGPVLGLAGCQTVEDERTVYSTTYDEDVYVDRPVYDSRVVVRRTSPSYGWMAPPPVIHRAPPPPPPPPPQVRRWGPPPPPPGAPPPPPYHHRPPPDGPPGPYHPHPRFR